MAFIGPTTTIGYRGELVTLDNPGPPVSNGDGGWDPSWVPCNPPIAYAYVHPAHARFGPEGWLLKANEAVQAGTTIGQAAEMIAMPFHPGVKLNTRITWGTRVFHVVGVDTPGGAGVETIALCYEATP